MTRRAASGAGTIRRKTVSKNGKQYSYWEARITIGRDPGSGRQIQQSFTGKTQREVREKMQSVAVAVNSGTYSTPKKMTLRQWMEIWAGEYLGNLKPGTVDAYTVNMRNHILPAMGAIRLSELHPHMVKTFINGLEGLSNCSVRLIYKILHMALEKAVQLEYIPRNPSDNCVLPKIEQKDICPLTDDETADVLTVVQGSEIENLVKVALFTGMRLSEILGLTWDCIDTASGSILVNKQLALPAHRQDGLFISPKSGKSRTIVPAGTVLLTLKKQQIRQAELRLKAGSNWQDSAGLVFSMPDGQPFDQWRVRRIFRKLLDGIGMEHVRFHDLRHTYAVNAIRAGDDIKTVQSKRGHSSAAFTLDRYGHFTERMRYDSAKRMEAFIRDVLQL